MAKSDSDRVIGILGDRIEQLEAENARLRKSLEPFAEFADRLTGANWVGDRCPVNADPGGISGRSSGLCVSSFREAKAALARPPEAGT